MLIMQMVMVIFTSIWVRGCPDIWSNVILDVSVRIFLNGLSKADCHPPPTAPMWVGLIQSVAGLDKTKSLRKRELLADYLRWHTGLLQPLNSD